MTGKVPSQCRCKQQKQTADPYAKGILAQNKPEQLYGKEELQSANQYHLNSEILERFRQQRR